MAGVSTHSRLKAAGGKSGCTCYSSQGFNTQPPEGGWLLPLYCRWSLCRFNTQPPEGGWQAQLLRANASQQFQHTAA